MLWLGSLMVAHVIDNYHFLGASWALATILSFSCVILNHFFYKVVIIILTWQMKFKETK